jgi:N6-L-threonylcarbamoyladenine synthase
MKQFNNLTILAIETSCDDTSISILRIKNLKFKILSNIVSSQIKLHQKYGGVYPSLAKREHQRNLLPVLKQTLKQSKLLQISKSEFLISKQTQNSKFKILNSILEREQELLKNLIKFLERYKKPKIDAIAITIGPGLEPCLWVGVNFARALGYFWDLPIIPINHIEAHILANFIGENKSLKIKSKSLFPAISLIVSGGHTQLILMKNYGKYKILGETRDDAAGECFDKVARILGLEYPGGPVIAAEAAKYQISNIKYQISLPRPMIYQKNYDFSFSGLKTAVLYNYKNQPPPIRKSKQYIQEMCAETQQAIIDVLIYKTIKAAKDYKVKTIILGGGVAANQELRKQLKNKIKKELPDTKYLIPDTKYCTDNAAMVAITGYYHWLKNKTNTWRNIKANANLRLG